MRISDWSSDVCSSDLEPAAVRHAIDDLAHTVLAAIFDDRFHRRDHRLAAIEADALGADIFARQEFLPFPGVDHLIEDRLLALRGDLDMLVGALHHALQKASLPKIGSVHIINADMYADLAPP